MKKVILAMAAAAALVSASNIAEANKTCPAKNSKPAFVPPESIWQVDSVYCTLPWTQSPACKTKGTFQYLKSGKMVVLACN